MKPTGNREFKEWLCRVMAIRPKGNYYIDSSRGEEVVRLMITHERDDFNWHRGDEDTFWIDVQMCVKYKITDEEIVFMMKQQPGTENYSKHAAERNAYAEMMRGLNKLRQMNTIKQWQDEQK